MPCFTPLNAWRSKSGTGVTFKQAESNQESVQLPCGRCIGCKYQRAEEWAVRICHEAQMHTQNIFVTLTYDDVHLPEDYGLQKADFQKFMKRLRYYERPKKLRYYMSGEYGTETLRPHYHAIIFGHDFPDKELVAVRNGNEVFTSKTLGKLWPYGFSSIGNVTFQSARYVAAYINKKIGGDLAEEHYKRKHPYTGKIHTVEREYSAMSLNPAVGKSWIEKYKSDVYPSGQLILEGKTRPIPKYYDKFITQEQLEKQKEKRKEAIEKKRKDFTPARLKEREMFHLSKHARKTREL